MSRSALILTFTLLVLPARGPILGLQGRAGAPASAEASAVLPWQTEARLHRGFRRTTSGILSVTSTGITFTGAAGSTRWPFDEIQGLDISARELLLTSYENRRHHQPGDRRYRFELTSELPPRVAAATAALLGKPSRNADPDARPPWFAAIPAKRETAFGGSNGELHFRDLGIDFITRQPGQARAWRWADIQTIANPDPYHFRIAAYREIYEFELKGPMSSELFDRLWESVYARNLNLRAGVSGGTHDR